MYDKIDSLISGKNLRLKVIICYMKQLKCLQIIGVRLEYFKSHDSVQQSLSLN